MTKKLSVIVPVFNAEKYLCQCLDSILSQPIENLEVICMNDGSTDNSKEILEEMQMGDERIRIVDKPNSGYGDSMNWGITVATGDYIAIVESDDMVVADKLAQLVNYAVQTDADVVKGNYYLYKGETDVVLYENFRECTYRKIINSNEEKQLYLTAPAIWSGVYRRKFLLENEIYFVQSPGASYQDTSFAFKVWVCAEKVYLVNEPIIYYRQDNTESSSNNNNKIFDIFNETAEMSTFLQRRKMNELQPLCMRAKFQSYAWTLARLTAENKLKFFLKLFYDVKVDFYEGNLIRRYWEEENWNIIFNIIFNLSEICRKTLGECQPKELEQIYSLLGKIGKVYIWEEEEHEEVLKQILQSYNVRIGARLAVDGEGNLVKRENGEREGSKILPSDRDVLIVFRSSRKDKSEIIKKLSENFMRNYIEINC